MADGRGVMRKRSVIFVLAVLAVFALSGTARAADVICYNCPPQWADFASMLKAVKADLGYDIPFDNKNSGQALSQIIAEKSNPVADIVY
jgi:putative spermidine/putrescine transport system substrate-binding protein